MDRVNYISRRSVVTWGLVSAGLSLLPTERVSARSAPLAQAGASENDELYEGKNLPGGGRIDPRLSVSPYANDEDIVEVAGRMSPFNPESCHVEWKRVAEKNERLAEEFEKEGLKVTANGFYLPAFNKLIDMYKRAWQLVPPPFDRVEIPYEGTPLPGYFAKPSWRESWAAISHRIRRRRGRFHSYGWGRRSIHCSRYGISVRGWSRSGNPPPAQASLCSPGLGASSQGGFRLSGHAAR